MQTAGCGVLSEVLGLSNKKRKHIELAAMTHDWDKKYQSTGLKKINDQVDSGEITELQGGKFKYDFFEESEQHNLIGMRRLGVPEDIIKYAITDGHAALPRMREPECTIEEKIVHYVGSITDESDIVSLDIRINHLEDNPRYKMINEYGKQIPWINGKTLYQVQRDVGHEVEKDIVKKLLELGSLSAEWQVKLDKDPTLLPDFIKDNIEENYNGTLLSENGNPRPAQS